MISVPISTASPDDSSATPPPKEVYLMMAAATMHREGRLVRPTPPSFVMGRGTEEWEPRPNPMAEEGHEHNDDKTGDIVRKLYINQLMAKRGYDI
jgi:hypothetical protein